MYRIWIWESRLILSHNQSKATLWFLDTCLIVGLRPFIIFFITASKTNNIALEPECVPFDRTWSMLIRSRLVCLVGIYFCMFGWVFVNGWWFLTPHNTYHRSTAVSQCRSISIEEQEKERKGLALVLGFPEAVSSSFLISIDSVTYFPTPFTILT